MADEVLYEQQDAVAVITLNRPEVANAQNGALTYALDAAFYRFAQDDSAKVAILRGAGKHFSAGHHLSSQPGADFDVAFPPVSMWWSHVGNVGAENLMAYEADAFLGMCRRWREIPKPTVAAVHGACVGGALALAWSCDLIVASSSAFFADPVVRMGCPGIEFFCHPWVMGSRVAREFLLLGERMPASRAYDVGMVNRVVPDGELDAASMEIAGKLATLPRFGAALTKMALNQADDAMGMRTGIDQAFALHQLSHAHNFHVSGSAVLVTQVEDMKEKGR